jgi:hypothetical protein
MPNAASHHLSPRAIAGLACLAFGLVVGTTQMAQAADDLDFIVPQQDGYGISECMKPGMSCGQVIADSWCEAHGHGHALTFGMSDDVTGSTTIRVAATSTVPPGSVVIHCGE